MYERVQKSKFFQSLKNPYIKTCIQLHIQDYVSAYNLDDQELEQEYLVHLGKGNAKRKKLIEENQKNIDDPQISEYDKQLYRYMNQILEFIVDPKNNKLAMLLLTIYFMNIDNIKGVILNKFYYSPRIQKASQDLIEQMDFFSFTHLSKDKILNSLKIIIYTLLVDFEKCDKHEATMFIDMILNTYFSKKDLSPRIRSDYLEKYQIYCAGIYNQLPIFMTYTGEKERYYNDEDIEKIQSFFNHFLQDQAIIKFINNLDGTQKKVSEFCKHLHNKEFIYELISNLHKHYIFNPASLIQLHCENARKQLLRKILRNPIRALKALMMTISTRLYTKLTTRNSFQKPS